MAIILGLVGLWVVLLALLWILRPKGVPLRELVRVIPDVVRLLRSVVSDRGTNFARPMKVLADPYPRTPAMAAGIADHVWTCEEVAALLD